MYIITTSCEGKPTIELSAIAWRVSADGLYLMEIYHTFVKQNVELVKKDGFGREVVHGIPMKTSLRTERFQSVVKEQMAKFHEKYRNCPIFIHAKKKPNHLRLKNMHFTELQGNLSTSTMMVDRLSDCCQPTNHRKKIKGHQPNYSCSLQQAFMLGTVYAEEHGLKMYDDLYV